MCNFYVLCLVFFTSWKKHYVNFCEMCSAIWLLLRFVWIFFYYWQSNNVISFVSFQSRVVVYFQVNIQCFMLYIFKHFNICIYISAEIENHYKTTTDMCTAEHLFPFLMKINFVSFRFFKWIFNHVTNYYTIKLLFKSQSFRSYRSYFIRLKIIYIHILIVIV